MFRLWLEEARWSRRRGGLTSVISKMLSGSRLPPPTFRTPVTMPLCVTEMIRLATEQAFSCRVASTTCLWPTCRKTVYTVCSTVCVTMGVGNSLHLSIGKWAYLAQGHYTGDVLYIKSHTVVRVIWQLDFLSSFVIRWYMHSGNSASKGIRGLCISLYEQVAH